MAGSSGPSDSGGRTYARDTQGRTQIDERGGRYYTKGGRMYREQLNPYGGNYTKDVTPSRGGGK